MRSAFHGPWRSLQAPNQPEASIGTRRATPPARRLVFWSVLAVLAVPAGGCSSGGGGSSPPPSGSSANGTASSVASTDLGGSRISVGFTLSTPVPKSVGVRVAYSEDRGENYSVASLESAPVFPAGARPEALPASPEGTLHSVVWRIAVDLQNLNQSDLRVRVTPYDPATGFDGVSSQSPVFGLGSNTAPEIAAISTPASARSGGWISFPYTVTDGEGDFVGLDGEFSLDGGASFSPATLGNGAPGNGALGNGALGNGDGADSVSASPAGAAHAIFWNAYGDAPEIYNANCRFRLRARDTQAGSFQATGTFTIDTRGPVLQRLTINAISAEMNGSIPFTNTSGQSEPFTLLAPPERFVIWIVFLAGASTIDAASLSVASDTSLGGGSAAGGVNAGADFGDLFTVDTALGVASLQVGSGLVFPDGLHTLTAAISDSLGNPSDPVGFTFETGAATASRRPFDSPERWKLDFARDNFAITSTIDAQQNVTVSATAGANGVADFVEDLRLLGLQSASPPQPAATAGLNGLVLATIEEAVLGRLNEFYGRNFDGTAGANGAAIQFTLGTPASPYSRIAIGGDDPVPGYTIGRAEYDYRNSVPNDDSDADLGIFTTNLIDFYLNSSFSFKARFNPLIPGRGTPLGFHAGDVTVLSESFDRSDPSNTQQENDRYDDIADAIDAISRVTAAILAHEIGHSVGLVANAAPSAGLFGGEYLASFARSYTTSFHLDTVENDIMAASLSFSGSILTGSSAPRFNNHLLAYLLERILLE